MNLLRYVLWPNVRMRLTYWWWVLKYGGKKNIPRELIGGEIDGSIMSMRENMMQALRHLSEDMSDADKKELLDAIRKADALQKEFNDAKNARKQIL